MGHCVDCCCVLHQAGRHMIVLASSRDRIVVDPKRLLSSTLQGGDVEPGACQVFGIVCAPVWLALRALCCRQSTLLPMRQIDTEE